MSNDSRAAFPNRIRALIVESDENFLRSASLMLSLLNYLVATCETPASAVKLLTGRLKDADVVFIDVLRATTCGFDFRGIVEHHLHIPVVYLFSFDYNIAGDVAEALQRNVWAATYVIKKPLEAEDLSRLWRIIQWSQLMLRRGDRALSWLEWPRGNQALPAAVQALLPSSSTSQDQGEDDDGHGHFQVAMAGRGRRRKLGDSHDGGSSGSGCGRGRGGVAVRGQPTRRLAEQMNVTEGQGNDDDDVYQQIRRGVHVMGVQAQQHGRSLFMQPVVPRMLNLPCTSPMISADAAGPSSSNVAAFAGASNASAPALLPLPVYQARARAQATSPQMFNVPCNNPIISIDAAGPSSSNVAAFAGASNTSATTLLPLPVYQAPARAPVPGLPPSVYQQQHMGRRKLGHSHHGGSSGCGLGRGRGGLAGSLEIGGQPARRLDVQMNVTEGQESDDDDVVPSHQQLARQNRRVLQAMDVQNHQHGRSLFMQSSLPQKINMPRNIPMISADAPGPSRSNVADFAAGASNNISGPELLPAYQAPSGATVTSQASAPGLPPMHQQQQPVAVHDFGKMVAHPAAAVPTMAATSGHRPPQFTLNQQQLQQDMFAPRRQDSWMGRRHETGPIMLSFEQPPAADQSPSTGAQPADSFDDVLRAMMEMNDTFPRSYYGSCSAEAPMSPVTDDLAAKQAALGSGNCSNSNAASFMVTNVNNGSSASVMAPQEYQDLTVPIGNQVELGALDFYGSLPGSPGPSAIFNGNGDMAAMFASDEYDENAMLSLDALWDFNDDVPMQPEGHQDAAAESTAATDATGIMPNGGENKSASI